MQFTISPTVVEQGEEAVLHCSYELAKNESVYCVKWYRGNREFYRYTPNNQPSTMVFPFPGITVDVSIQKMWFIFSLLFQPSCFTISQQLHYFLHRMV